MNHPGDAAKRGGISVTVLGAIAIFFGVLCMIAPVLTGISIALIVGFFVLAGGFARIFWAFKAGSMGRGILTFVIGVLTVICGLMLVSDPVLASGFLTIMLAFYLFVDGIAEIAAGNRMRPQPGSGWMIFGGVLSLLLGAMIWSQYPLSGAWAIGILLGIKLFSVGLIMITGGSVIRSAAKEM